MALPNTHFGYVKINEIIGDGPKKIFFSGIGGISMNSLAAVCMARGHKVSGYDRTESDITDRLAAEGAEVYYESSADIVKDADALVYTVAIPEDDPAYVYAGEHGIPRISRADFLGYVMMSYASRVGICGMHGKSTTTGFAASVYTAAGLDPTVFGGAELKSTGTSNVLGGHRAFVFEACEYMDSFLDFYPTTAVVLNVEMDHVDYFHSMEQIRDSFGKFMAKAEVAVVNADDENVMLSTKKCDTKLVTFGMKDADYTPGEVTYSRGCASFDIFHKGKLLCRAELKVPGRHMVYDVLAVAAAAHTDGIPGDAIARGVAAYDGIKRRMELRGKTTAGFAVYDDYAHHPTEIRSALSTAVELGYKKNVCVFQPHTFSRTAGLFDDFADALGTSGVDEVIFAETYPARETNTFGVSSALLAEKVKEKGMKCTVGASFDEIAALVTEKLGDGDAVFVVGAGDVIKVSDILMK